MTLPPMSDAELIGEDIAHFIVRFRESKDNFKYIKASIVLFIYGLIFYLMMRQSM